ncbi:MAG: tetratricopeptide repeat protein [Proteobacteria bacterium]|nr:tetratricopeptide repeat protein [Pseudomonadota bacterium]
MFLLAAPALAPAGDAARYVGSAACADCHADEARRWRASHHAQSMQVASPATVLGDFRDVRVSHHGQTTRFFRKGEAFYVRTAGADGREADFQVTHTFGVHPLQQYLVALPGGRLQALGVAWDTRRREDGGQRWYHLYPDAPPKPGEPVHWSGREQNWNFMCASCHSTGLVKNYDLQSDRYRTRWAEMAVGCEACHGPASAHLAWARGGKPTAVANAGLTVATRQLRRLVFRYDGSHPIARGDGDPKAGQRAGEACFGCHSRRQQLTAEPRPGAAFLDDYRPALVEPGLYHPDGQIDDEVFEYGSFVQSRMHRAGVTCSHCHDSHSLKLRADGNTLCGQCHLSSRYDRPEHHRHGEGSAGAQCVSCHMPTKTYMGVHVRRDHRLAVPRPAQSARLGTPDACTACHKDKSPAWAAAAIERWTGRPEAATTPPVAVLAGRRAGVPLAELLSAEYPAIQQAGALLRLAGSPAAADAVARAARSGEGLLRLGAARALAGLALPEAWRIGDGLLDDPLRAVRTEAARTLAAVPAERLPPARRERLGAVLAELIASEELAADRPESHVNLARIHAARGQPQAAEQALRTALRLDAGFLPALVNLADLYRANGREADGEATLRQAVKLAPAAAEPAHALGLALIRQGRRDAALPELARAAALAPDNGRYALVLAVAQLESGQGEAALATLAAARVRLPEDVALLRTLVQIERRLGRPEAAAHQAELLRLERGFAAP